MMLKLFFAALLLLGLALAAFGIHFIATGNAAEHWVRTEGRVLSVSVRTDLSMAGGVAISEAARERRRRYYPSIHYRWRVDGQAYTGSRYRLGTTHEKYPQREDAVAAAAAWRSGAALGVYYDPADPAQAVLDNSLSGAVFVPLPLGLLMALLGGLGLRYRGALQRAQARVDAEPLAMD